MRKKGLTWGYATANGDREAAHPLRGGIALSRRSKDGYSLGKGWKAHLDSHPWRPPPLSRERSSQSPQELAPGLTPFLKYPVPMSTENSGSASDPQREKFLAALEKKKGKGGNPAKSGGNSGPKISGAQQRGGIARQNVQRKSGGA